MRREWIINRQGKDMVLYAGLLDQAHKEGLKRISTKLLQAPSAENGQLAICYAEVETERGLFSGIGDASPGNVGKQIIPHLLRMSETRAKARALRDAINVGVTCVEELGDADDAEPVLAAEFIDLIVRGQTKLQSLGAFTGDPRQVPEDVRTAAQAAALVKRYQVQVKELTAAPPAPVPAEVAAAPAGEASAAPGAEAPVAAAPAPVVDDAPSLAKLRQGLRNAATLFRSEESNDALRARIAHISLRPEDYTEVAPLQAAIRELRTVWGARRDPVA